jgi:hypothetical protein
MAEKRRRPTRDELDERLRSVLDRIPADVEPTPETAAPLVATRQWTRIVSGTIAVPPTELRADPDDFDAAANA